MEAKYQQLLENAYLNLQLFSDISTRIYCNNCERVFVFLDKGDTNLWGHHDNYQIKEFMWSNPCNESNDSDVKLTNIDLEKFECTCSLCEKSK